MEAPKRPMQLFAAPELGCNASSSGRTIVRMAGRLMEHEHRRDRDRVRAVDVRAAGANAFGNISP